ncbi:MAG: hypothetical protein ACI4IN_06535 [Eubacterium sp.]
MIKAMVKQENNEGGVGVELEFKGTTTEALYEHAMLTLALLSRLTSRTDDPIKRKREMRRMLDALGAATAMLITDGMHTDKYCRIAEQSSVVIDHDIIRKMRNRGGDDNE